MRRGWRPSTAGGVTGRTVLVWVIAAATVASGSPPALGSTFAIYEPGDRSASSLSLTGSDEGDDIAVSPADGSVNRDWLVTDPAGVSVLDSCTTVTPAEARCPGSDSPNMLVTANGGDDLVRLDDRGTETTIDGGAGDDRLLGGSGNDAFVASSGHDTVDGAGGVNTVELPHGGTVDLPRGRVSTPDGAMSLSRVEDVRSPTSYEGVPTRVQGDGTANAILIGAGTVSAGGGNDTISTQQARVSCGAGFDRVLQVRTGSHVAADCERLAVGLERNEVWLAPAVHVTPRVDGRRTLRVRVLCENNPIRGCSGWVTLALPTVTVRRHYVVDPGDPGWQSFRLPRRAAPRVGEKITVRSTVKTSSRHLGLHWTTRLVR
jgi:hypothetical protein